MSNLHVIAPFTRAETIVLLKPEGETIERCAQRTGLSPTYLQRCDRTARAKFGKRSFYEVLFDIVPRLPKVAKLKLSRVSTVITPRFEEAI